MLTFHKSSPTKWHWSVEKVGRQTDGQKKEWVEEKAVVVELDSASCLGGSWGDKIWIQFLHH